MDESKHYLYRIQPTRHEMLTEGATPGEAQIIGEHFTYLKRLTREGVAILVGRTLSTEQDSMGIVIFTARSDEEARALMEVELSLHVELAAALAVRCRFPKPTVPVPSTSRSKAVTA